MTELEVGKEIGPYRILQKIAQGGMNPVYKGLHTGLEQEVAIKVLDRAALEDPAVRTRFINEAKIQASLSHPNVIKVLNYLEQDETVFLIMEYINGETLDVLIKKAGALPVDQATTIFSSVLEAVAFMHAKGIVHRDIKPANIMISYDGFVKVMDFGIARTMGESGKTQAGIRMGTLWYMSPEQIRGEDATVSSDIYALGATLYQMVTGQVPFSGSLEFDIMKGHLEKPPQPPWQINNGITKELGEIILTALAKRREERYQNAGEFLAALRGISPAQDATRAIGERPQQGMRWNVRRISGNRNRILLLAAVCIALALLAVVVFFRTPGKSDPGTSPEIGAQGVQKNDSAAVSPHGESSPPVSPKKTGSSKKRLRKEQADPGQSAEQKTDAVSPAETVQRPEGASEWRIRK